MMLRFNKKVLMFFGFFGFLFWILGFGWLDPDFGWHYRMGKIISSYGLPETDPFTYSMPSYPYVDYEWMSNLVYFWLFEFGGMKLLSLLNVLFVLFVPIALFYKTKSKYWVLPTMVFFTGSLRPFGVRPQVISWFFFAVLVRLTSSEQFWRQNRKFYPALMFLWANFHGSHLLGLVYLWIWLGVLFFQKRLLWKDILFGVLGFLSILVNPYGVNNLLELIKQMAQANFFRKTIFEWYPSYVTFEPAFLFSTLLLLVFGAYVYRRIDIKYLILSVVMFLSGMSGVRQIPLFLVFFTLMFDRIFYLVESTKGVSKARLRMFYGLLTLVFLSLFLVEFYVGYWEKTNKFVEGVFYPTTFVEKAPDLIGDGRLFSDFGFGGYLIWKMPNTPLFVDGRMAGFSWDAPEGESDHAFREYMDLTCGYINAEEVFDKYGVTYVLTPRTREIEQGVLAAKLSALIKAFDYGYCKDGVYYLDSLLDAGKLDRVYEDESVFLYKRI